jgi:hypothetical protein
MLPLSWKLAEIEVDDGDFASGIVSSTVGRAVPVMTLQPLITKDFSSLRNIGKNEVEALVKKINKLHNRSLDGVKVYVGGSRPVDMLKRVWTNPRNGVFGKLIGTASVPATYVRSSITRGDSYNPYSNTVQTFSKNPSALLHELGHAEDFNSEEVPETTAGKEWNGLKRTVYGAGMYPVQPLTSYIEYKAWQNARKTIKKVIHRFPHDKELHNRLIDSYYRSMPGFFGSYLGNAVSPGMGSIAGSVGASMIPMDMFKRQLLAEIAEERKQLKKSKKENKRS